MDLCRGRNVKIFDMYYDKYGPGAVKKLTLVTEEQTQDFGDINHLIKRKENE